MEKRLTNAITILFIIFLFSMFDLVIVRVNFLNYLGSITVAFIMIMTLIAYLLFGFRKDKINIFKKSCIFNVLIVILCYFIVYYFSGLLFGFLHNSYSLNFTTIISNTIIPLLFLLFIEILRYILVLAVKETKLMIGLTTVVFTVLEVVTFYNLFEYSLVGLFKLLTLAIMPVFAKNLLCGYLDAYVTIRIALIYRLIFDLYAYIVPIFPNVGDYIKCVLGIVVPYIVYYFVSKNSNMYEHKMQNDFVPKYNSKLGDSVFITTLIIFVCLISCMFPLFLMSVGSESMEPVLNKGDAIFAYKVSKEEKIDKGDIIVFNSDNKVVIHRVNNIVEKNGTTFYETKGDANNTKDVDLIEFKRVRGKVLTKIPLIGYPSVMLNKLLNYKIT